MSASNASHRPQTLKQAKRAYQKSSRNTRPSASEIAAAERRALLQERADRIRDREARRKANVKKREEKLAREKEAAVKIGLQLDKGKNWHNGPSQLDLETFLKGAPKNVGDDQAAVRHEPSETTKQIKDEKLEEGLDLKGGSALLVPIPMAPPPRPMPADAIAQPATANGLQTCDTVALKTDEMTEYDDFLVSNTQIAHELLETPCRDISPVNLSPDRKTPPTNPSTAVLARRTEGEDEEQKRLSEQTMELLASISTQDLEMHYEPTQLNTKAEDVSQGNGLQRSMTTQELIECLSPLVPDENVYSEDASHEAEIIKPNEFPALQPTRKISTGSFSEDDLTDRDFHDLALRVESKSEYLGRFIST